jgi:hypothetical protein
MRYKIVKQMKRGTKQTKIKGIPWDSTCWFRGRAAAKGWPGECFVECWPERVCWSGWTVHPWKSHIPFGVPSIPHRSGSIRHPLPNEKSVRPGNFQVIESFQNKNTHTKNKIVKKRGKKKLKPKIMQKRNNVLKEHKLVLTNGMPWACCPGIVGTGLPVAKIF